MKQHLQTVITGDVVDIDLAKRLLGKKEFVDEMLDMFAKELVDETNKINTALEQKNWDTLISLAHKIKGGASYCGAIRLKEACSQLMACLKSDATESRVQLVQQMINEIQALQEFVKSKK